MIMKRILINFVLLIIGVVLSYVSAVYFGFMYSYLYPSVGGIFSIPQRAGDFLIGLPLAYISFLTFLFTAFGNNQSQMSNVRGQMSDKYWWIGIGLLPAAAFELYFDLPHIYFPIALGLVAWLLGFAISRFFPSLERRG